MRKLILLAALMISARAFAADSSTFELRNAGDLAKVCSLASDHALHANGTGFCHGILLGAYRYYESTATAENRFVCPPNPTPTRAEVMDGYVTWAKSHPQYMNDPPVDTLFRYLGETYPCAN